MDDTCNEYADFAGYVPTGWLLEATGCTGMK